MKIDTLQTVTINTARHKVVPLRATAKMKKAAGVFQGSDYDMVRYEALLGAVPDIMHDVTIHSGEPDSWLVTCKLSDGTVFERFVNDPQSLAEATAIEVSRKELYTYPPKQSAREIAQAQQLRYALYSLHRIAQGEQSPEKHAAIAIKHITCGTYVPELKAPQ